MTTREDPWLDDDTPTLWSLRSRRTIDPGGAVCGAAMADVADERLPSPRARSEWELMDDFETPLRPFRTGGSQPFLVLATDDGSGPTDQGEVADGAAGA